MSYSNSINRRRFLIAAGGLLVGSTLMCGGVTALGNQMPTVEYIHSECGKRPTMDKVLVAYASKIEGWAEQILSQTA